MKKQKDGNKSIRWSLEYQWKSKKSRKINIWLEMEKFHKQEISTAEVVTFKHSHGNYTFP